MRDDDGIFVGVHICRHWNGISRYVEKECCGGRKYRAAYCLCALKGEVLAEGLCCAACMERVENRVKIP